MIQSPLAPHMEADTEDNPPSASGGDIIFPEEENIQLQGVPQTAPVQSVLYDRYSKTDPEVPAHLNLYGSPIADDRALCTQWQKGL